MEATFRPGRGPGGVLAPPADKSITHRALMLAAVAEGPSRLRAPLATGDCLSTRACLAALGAVFEPQGRDLVVHGRGMHGLREPAAVLDAGNSGTTMRLLAGLLAGRPFLAVLAGDQSLARRPMGRVVEPLRAMGAAVEARADGTLAPLCFLPGDGRLRGIRWQLPVASAQVKGAVLLAALRCDGPTLLTGAVASRDHTERLFAALGLGLSLRGGEIRAMPADAIPGFEIAIPGDVSSAAFFMAAALAAGRDLEVTACGINPTRLGFVEVVRRMGAEIEVRREGESLGEPVGTLRLHAGPLRGTVVEARELPGLVDEVPLVAVLGLFADGVTEVRGAGELRAKESDRLQAIARLAEALGGRVEVRGDDLRVEGRQRLSPGVVDPRGDHRIAMAAAAAAAGIPGGVRVTDIDCARVSYPDFLRDYRSLGGEVA